MRPLCCSPSSVHFGGHGVVFALNCSGRAADGAKGNTANSVNNDSTYQPDEKGIGCGVEFFAGSECFAAADIEVYEL